MSSLLPALNRVAHGVIGAIAGPRLMILIFHRVHRTPDPLFPNELDAAKFDALLQILQTSFRVLPLRSAVTAMREGSLPSRALAITFDDGYADNYTDAFPILRDLSLPATVFLTTGPVETGQSLWFDRVLRAFERSPRERVALPGGEMSQDLEDDDQRGREAIRALYALMRLSDQERLAAVDRLVRDLGGEDGSPPTPMLSWDQVREMARAGITFGAHTVTHPILSRLSLSDAKAEIVESKRRIEEETGLPVTLFAYPVGRRSDYSPEVIRAVADAGFRAAFTTTPGANARGDDRFLLRRVKPWGEDVPSFALGLGVQYLTEWSPRE